MIQEVNVARKNISSLRVTVFNPENSSSQSSIFKCYYIYFRRTLATTHCCIHNIFDRYFYLNFEWTVSISRGQSWFLLRLLCLFEISTCSHPFFQTNWLICRTSCSHPFLERPFILLHKLAVVAMYSFKLTLFFRQEIAAMRYYSLQLNYQLWYLLGCRHVFIRIILCYLITSFTSIHFFMVLLLFHGNTLRNLFCQGLCVYFKTLKHYIKQTVLTLRTFEESNCSPTFLRCLFILQD